MVRYRATARTRFEGAIAGGFLSLFIAILVFVGLKVSSRSIWLELDVASAGQAQAQLFFDTGSGYSEGNSALAQLQPGNNHIRFYLPAEHIVALRLDPARVPGRFQIDNIRFTHRDRVLSMLSPASLQPLNQISSLSVVETTAIVETTPDATDPSLNLSLPAPLNFDAIGRGTLWMSLTAGLATVVAGVAAGALFARRFSAIAQCVSSYVFATGRRKRTTAIAILIAALGSVYPVIFMGQSFATPMLQGVPLIYASPPFAPGVPLEPREEVNGADVGAFPWQSRPWSVVQHEAVFVDREAPLWNRYSAGGLPLLGQGISMMGDPLHWIAIAANGAAWAWDVKFVLAKVLFGLGIGWLVWLAVRNYSVAALLGASSTYIGFFAFRINHSGFFTLCYEPWVLAGWLALATGSTRGLLLSGTAALFFGNLSLVASGALKEAVVSFGCLNLIGVLCLLTPAQHRRDRWRRFLSGSAAVIAALALQAPMIIGFLQTLAQSRTGYDEPTVIQQPLLRFGALFDTLLNYPQPTQIFPALNLLIGVGFCWAIARIRRLVGTPIFAVVSLGALACFAMIYGLVPASLILRIPFLANIYHIHISFTHPLLIFLIVIAGYGYRDMMLTSDRSWWTTYVLAGGLLAALCLFSLMDAAIEPHITSPKDPRPIVIVLIALALLLPILFQAITRVGRANVALISASVVLFVFLHARGAIEPRSELGRVDDVTVNFASRPDYSQTSTAVRMLSLLRGPNADPFRLVGVGNVMWPGYTSAVGIESVSGPDPLKFRPYEELLDAGGLPRSWYWALMLAPDDLQAYSGLFDVLGVAYLAAPQEMAANPSFRGLQRVVDADLAIFRRSTAWPRAFFVNRVETGHSPAEIVDRAEAEPGRPFAIVEAKDALDLPEPVGATGDRYIAPARDYRLSANKIEFTIDAPSAGLVVLGENAFDGFKASANGDSLRIVRVNHAFMGVVLNSPGTYVVRFSFDPIYARQWVLALIAGMIALALAFCVVPRTENLTENSFTRL